MSIEGELHIRLRPTGAVIQSTRPVHASRMFEGKAADEVVKNLPLLFSICGVAQQVASLRAVEGAMGIQPTQEVERQREALVRMETLREHLWRILLDWPLFIGGQPVRDGMSEVLTLQRNLMQQLNPDGSLFRIGTGEVVVADGGVMQQITAQATALLQRVLGISPQQWLELDTLEQLQRWVESTVGPIAGVLELLQVRGWQAVGDCETHPLPLPLNNRIMAALDASYFIEQPQWQGSCCETTALTRVETPLIMQANRTYGSGLLPRLLARLSEMAQLATQLLPERMAEIDSLAAQGIGQVAAARGHLLHQVALEQDRVSRYRILAPTEWNFHPQGVAAQALATIEGDDAELQARLLINAIDPCVGYQLQIEDAPDA